MSVLFLVAGSKVFNNICKINEFPPPAACPWHVWGYGDHAEAAHSPNTEREYRPSLL